MAEKKSRKTHFSFKELRLSIAQMALWSLLAVALFTYLIMELGEKMGRGPFYFIILFAGYVLIVIILTMVFTHRFLGPFERLKTELRIIRSSNHYRRLSVRNHDDLYIRSFIVEVDKLLDELEKMYSFKKEFSKKIDSELSNMKSIIEKKEISKEELIEAVTSLNKKIEALVEERKPR